MKDLILGFLLSLFIANRVSALNNGVALTPPMGWMSWQRFRCITDCISEKLVKSIADRMVTDGYRDAGYEYVIIDDCWLSKQRSKDGKLQEDPVRFPSGMKKLADYVHSKGLKFGIYEDYGTYTCGGYPGVINHIEQDVKTLVDMGADYIKLDGCYAGDPIDLDQGYIKFGRYLQTVSTKRKVVYSCSWPVYQEVVGITPNLSLISEHCNLWRNWGDIQDSWESVKSILDYYARKQEMIVPHAGPGHWNDPDMLIIGNYGLSLEQSKSQMALWAILAAPLLMSHDLRNVRPEFRDILLNKDVIKVNQDPLGIQGKRVYLVSSIEIWTKPIQPIVDGKYSYAVAILSKRTDGNPFWIDFTLRRIGLMGDYYMFRELFKNETMAVEKNRKTSVKIPPSGVLFYKAHHVLNRKKVQNNLGH